VGVVPSNVEGIERLSVATVGEITPPLERVNGPGPVSTNWPAVVHALTPFWHWYRPVEVEQNEPAAPAVGGLVAQAEMPPPAEGPINVQSPATEHAPVVWHRYCEVPITQVCPAVPEANGVEHSHDFPQAGGMGCENALNALRETMKNRRQFIIRSLPCHTPTDWDCAFTRYVRIQVELIRRQRGDRHPPGWRKAVGSAARFDDADDYTHVIVVP